MLRRCLDLFAVGLAADAAGLLVTLMPEGAALRALAALSLVLFLPGYALAAAVFPGGELGRAERGLFSVGLSLAVTALGTVGLDRTPSGLQAGSWTILLMAVTLAAALAALVRRWGARVAVAHPPLGFRWDQALAVGLAALGALAAVGLASVPAPARGDVGYTQLWLLPAPDGGSDTVQLGVACNEFAATQYRVEVWVDGSPTQTWQEVTLAPGEAWQQAAGLPQGRATAVVEAKLYRLDAPDSVYRRATLRVDSNER